MSGQMDSAERLARIMGWTVDYERLGRQHFASLECHSFSLPASEIATLLSWHDLAQAASDLAEALKGCNGALIGASEALLARGYVATADTLKKYIVAGEEALARWNALKGEANGK